MKAVEMFYTVQATALLLSCCDKTVLSRLKAGEFGADVVNLGTAARPDYRLPASGINGYLTARRVFSEFEPVVARSEAELRRKAA